MSLGESCDPLDVVHTGRRFLQGVRVDVRCIDEASRQKSCFAQEYRQRIDFFARAAAGYPHFERGIRAQYRDYGLAQRTEVTRIAEHLADRYREQVEQCRKNPGVVQHLVLELGKGMAPETSQRGGEPPLQRRRRIT